MCVLHLGILSPLWRLQDPAPRGLQIGWPFSSEFYISPITVFPRFLHHTTGADMIEMITALFSIDNFKTMLFEGIVLLPIVWLVYRFNRTIETNS